MYTNLDGDVSKNTHFKLKIFSKLKKIKSICSKMTKLQLKYGKVESMEKGDGLAYILYVNDLKLNWNDDAYDIIKKNVQIQLFTIRHDKHNDNLFSFEI